MFIGIGRLVWFGRLGGMELAQGMGFETGGAQMFVGAIWIDLASLAGVE